MENLYHIFTHQPFHNDQHVSPARQITDRGVVQSSTHVENRYRKCRSVAAESTCNTCHAIPTKDDSHLALYRIKAQVEVEASVTGVDCDPTSS
jgi:uncharacterized protein (DUF885 family)